MTPPSSTPQNPGATKVDEQPEAHVPSDDDTYSPLHEEEAKDEKSA
jgi:hypothetical protein